MRAICACAIAVASLPAFAGATLHFEPASPAHRDAARAYAAIWSEHGEAIAAALEKHACSALPGSPIRVIVDEAVSYSGSRHEPMVLRASYAAEVKRGAIVHELGHRLIPGKGLRATGLNEHQALDLLLLRVLDELWGAGFVREQVAVESRWSRSYRAAWAWAVSLSPEERRLAWDGVLRGAGRVCE